MNICIVENCNNIVHTNGYCQKHNRQIKKHGRLTPEKERNVNTNNIITCYAIKQIGKLEYIIVNNLI